MTVDPPLGTTESLAHLSAIRDPVERAMAAQTASEDMRAWVTEVLAIRDAALREALRSGLSRPVLARDTGINLATVKAVTR